CAYLSLHPPPEPFFFEHRGASLFHFGITGSGKLMYSLLLAGAENVPGWSYERICSVYSRLSKNVL
ncbi:MAG: hypothetical protein R6U22_05400, partial [Desulfohalobiaceae bacterium]